MSVVRHSRGVLALGGALLLAGCGLFGFQEAETVGCPAVGILGDADRITVFAPGGGRDVRDIEYRGRIGRVASQCEIDDGRLDIELLFEIEVQRGPADADRTVTTGFFIAQAHARTREINFRRDYSETVEFDANEVRQVFEVEESYGYNLDPDEKPSELNVFVGFALSPDQLEYNRRARQRR